MTSIDHNERVKYEQAWTSAEYRRVCYSLNLWADRRELFPAVFKSAVDLGCGLGLLVKLWLESGIDAWGFDIAENCLHESVSKDRLVVGTLWDMRWGKVFDLGVCTDVMEHIPTYRVAKTLHAISQCCHCVVFKIAHVPDVCGGGSYHLTVRPVEWWLEQMSSVGGRANFKGTVERSGFQDSIVVWDLR